MCVFFFLLATSHLFAILNVTDEHFFLYWFGFVFDILMHGGVKFDGDVFKHEMENKQREKEKKITFVSNISQPSPTSYIIYTVFICTNK